MFRNLATWDRVARALLGVALIPMTIFLQPHIAFGLPAVYLLMTAVVGNCWAYTLLHRNTYHAHLLAGVEKGDKHLPYNYARGGVH